MSLHEDTLAALSENKHKFTQEIQQSIKIVLNLIEKYSGLSDTMYLLQKSNQTLPGITLPDDSGWLPIRNLARIIAKVSSLDIEDIITKIEIESMECGCDYFKGIISVYVGGAKMRGQYKWQWTAFPGRERSFDKFVVFPILTLQAH